MQKENRQFLAEYGARKAKETQEHDIEPLPMTVLQKA